MAGIFAADRNRREFLPELLEALNDESSVGHDVAMEFYGIEFDEPSEDDWDRLIAELDDLQRLAGS